MTTEKNLSGSDEHGRAPAVEESSAARQSLSLEATQKTSSSDKKDSAKDSSSSSQSAPLPDMTITDSKTKSNDSSTTESAQVISDTLSVVGQKYTSRWTESERLKVIKEQLENKSSAEVAQIAAAFAKAWNTGESMEEVFRRKLSGSNADEAVNLLHKNETADGKLDADAAGKIHQMIIERQQWVDGRRDESCEEAIRRYVSSLSKTQYQKLEQDYAQRFGNDNSVARGPLADALARMSKSEFTKDCLDVFSKGADSPERDQNISKLMEKACADGNIDEFKEIAGLASEKARQMFLDRKGLEQIVNKFSGMISNANVLQAIQLAENGKLDEATLIKENIGKFSNNDVAIEQILEHMSPERRKLFIRGEYLASHPGEATEEDGRAVQLHKDLKSAFEKALPYMQGFKMHSLTDQARFEGGSIIKDIASYSSTRKSGTNQQILSIVENMDRSRWNILRNTPGYSESLPGTLREIVGNNEKCQRANNLIYQKMAMSREITNATAADLESKSIFASLKPETRQVFLDGQKLDKAVGNDDKAIQKLSEQDRKKLEFFREFEYQTIKNNVRRPILEALDDNSYTFSNDRKSMLSCLGQMTPEEQRRYRTDETFRGAVDDKIRSLMGGSSEHATAMDMLHKVIKGETPAKPEDHSPPEEKLSSFVNGKGVSLDEVKELLKGMTPEQRTQLLSKYSSRYHRDGVHDILDHAGSERADLQRLLRTHEVTIANEFISAVDGATKSDGYGNVLKDSMGYDGTRDKMRQDVGAINKMVQDVAAGFGKFTPAEQQRLIDQAVSSLKQNKISKEEFANTIIDTVVLAGSVIAAPFTSGASLTPLLYAGAVGAALKTGTKSLVMGDDYEARAGQIVRDVLTGASGTALFFVNPSHVGALFKIGQQAAQTAVANTVKQLVTKGLTSEGERLIQSQVTTMMREAIAHGVEGVEGKAFAELATELVAKGMLPKGMESTLVNTLSHEVNTSIVNYAKDFLGHQTMQTLTTMAAMTGGNVGNAVLDGALRGDLSAAGVIDQAAHTALSALFMTRGANFAKNSLLRNGIRSEGAHTIGQVSAGAFASGLSTFASGVASGDLTAGSVIHSTVQGGIGAIRIDSVVRRLRAGAEPPSARSTNSPEIDINPSAGSEHALAAPHQVAGSIERNADGMIVAMTDAQGVQTKIEKNSRDEVVAIATSSGEKYYKRENEWHHIKGGEIEILRNVEIDNRTGAIVTSKGQGFTQERVTRNLDGSVVDQHGRVLADGSVADHKGKILSANVDVELAKLEHLTGQIKDAKDKGWLRSSLAAFDNVGSGQRRLSNLEKARLYHAVSDILTANESHLTAAERAQIAGDILFNCADPYAVNQGEYRTCPEAQLAVRMYATSPADAAALIRDAVKNCQVQTERGTIKIRPEDMRSDAGTQESRNNRHLNGNGEFWRRSHADKILQNIMVNAHWQGKTHHVLTTYEYHPQEHPGDSGERLMRDGKVVAAFPNIVLPELESLFHQLTGKDERFVIAHRDANTGIPSNQTFSTPEELKALTDQLGASGPIIVAVASRTGDDINHVISIVGQDTGADGSPKLHTDNTHGPGADTYVPAAGQPRSIENVYEAATPLRERLSPADYLEYLRKGLDKHLEIERGIRALSGNDAQVRRSETTWQTVSPLRHAYELSALKTRLLTAKPGTYPDAPAVLKAIESEVRRATEVLRLSSDGGAAAGGVERIPQSTRDGDETDGRLVIKPGQDRSESRSKQQSPSKQTASDLLRAALENDELLDRWKDGQGESLLRAHPLEEYADILDSEGIDYSAAEIIGAGHESVVIRLSPTEKHPEGRILKLTDPRANGQWEEDWGDRPFDAKIRGERREVRLSNGDELSIYRQERVDPLDLEDPVHRRAFKNLLKELQQGCYKGWDELLKGDGADQVGYSPTRKRAVLIDYSAAAPDNGRFDSLQDMLDAYDL